MENNMQNSLDEKLGKTKFEVFDSALACLLFIIYNFIFIEIYRLVPHSEPVTYVAQFLVEFLFAVAAFTVTKVRKRKFFEAVGAKKKVSAKLVGLALAISVVSLFFFGNLTDVFLEILYALGYKSQLSNIEVDAFWKLLVYTLVSCLTPAVCEEILFRGTILSGLKSFGLKIAVVVSAVVFTLMHGNPEQTVHQFVIGCIIGLIFFKTGNLWIGVLVHFFNNFLAILSAYLVGLVTRTGSLENTANQPAAPVNVNVVSVIFDIFFAISLAVIGIMIVKILIAKAVRENERINPAESEANLQGETTINVDGNEVVTTMTIDGEEVKTEEKLSVASDGREVKQDKAKALSIPVIVLFALSGLYLVADWLIALVLGFL